MAGPAACRRGWRVRYLFRVASGCTSRQPVFVGMSILKLKRFAVLPLVLACAPGLAQERAPLRPALQRFDTNVFQPGVQSIPAAGVTGLMDYFRQ